MLLVPKCVSLPEVLANSVVKLCDQNEMLLVYQKYLSEQNISFEHLELEEMLLLEPIFFVFMFRR